MSQNHTTFASSMDAAISQSDRLQAAMPDAVAEFYAILRLLDPVMWQYVRQYSEPRAAAIGVIQHMRQISRSDADIDAFINNVENLRSKR